MIIFGAVPFQSSGSGIYGGNAVICVLCHSLRLGFFGEGTRSSEILLNAHHHTHNWCSSRGDWVLVNSRQCYLQLSCLPVQVFLADVDERKECIAIHQLRLLSTASTDCSYVQSRRSLW